MPKNELCIFSLLLRTEVPVAITQEESRDPIHQTWLTKDTTGLQNIRHLNVLLPNIYN